MNVPSRHQYQWTYHLLFGRRYRVAYFKPGNRIFFVIFESKCRIYFDRPHHSNPTNALMGFIDREVLQL